MLILDLMSKLPSNGILFLYTAVNLGSRMGFERGLRLRGKLAVVPDKSGSHKVLVWRLVC